MGPDRVVVVVGGGGRAADTAPSGAPSCPVLLEDRYRTVH